MVAQDNTNPIKPNTEQGKPANLVANKLQNQVGKPNTPQSPEISQTSDPLHQILVAEKLRDVGKIIGTTWA